MPSVFVALGDVQIPILASMLLGGCAAKLAKTLRNLSLDVGLGPTALFPLRMRRPAAIAMCAIESGLGISLILTSGPLGRGGPAEFARLGTGLLFVLATCALIELRGVRPDVGCGCFGELSTAPITPRILARSALLGVAALAIIGLPPIQLPRTGGQTAELLVLFAAEVAVIGALSPEVRETLVRIGYSEPCEIRVIPAEQTLAALHRSAQWRKHSGLIVYQGPADTWRELCWRYFTFASTYRGRDTELVFAVYLQQRRPVVVSVLVDAVSGAVVPWPTEPARGLGDLLPRLLHGVPRLLRGLPQLNGLTGDSGRAALDLGRLMSAPQPGSEGSLPGRGRRADHAKPRWPDAGHGHGPAG